MSNRGPRQSRLVSSPEKVPLEFVGSLAAPKLVELKHGLALRLRLEVAAVKGAVESPAALAAVKGAVESPAALELGSRAASETDGLTVPAATYTRLNSIELRLRIGSDLNTTSEVVNFKLFLLLCPNTWVPWKAMIQMLR